VRFEVLMLVTLKMSSGTWVHVVL